MFQSVVMILLILKHVVNSQKYVQKSNDELRIKKKNLEENNNPATETTVATQQISTVTKTRKSISFTSRLNFAAHDLNRTEISYMLSKDNFDDYDQAESDSF
jgi:hypothetical protein